MNLRKNLGRVASTIVATALLASVATVPAFAEGGVQVGANDQSLSELKITKELNMPENVVTSGVAKFDFTLAPVTVTGEEKITSGGTTFDVKSGIGDSVTVEDVTFEKGSDDGDTQTVTFSLNDFTAFTVPGVYKYQITEAADESNPVGFNDATTKLDVYLFVEDTNGATEGGIRIYAAVVSKETEDADKTTGNAKTETWVNNYMMDATGSLTVTKEIAGAMASPNDVFTFTISDLTPNRTYVVESTYDAEITSVVASEQGEATFELSADKSWTIKGLEAGEYTVKEADSGKGYTLTSVVADEGDTATNVNESEKLVGAEVNVVKDNEAGITVTNTRNSVTPTGIVMNVAPYALLVVVAVAGCFVFLRKRNED